MVTIKTVYISNLKSNITVYSKSIANVKDKFDKDFTGDNSNSDYIKNNIFGNNFRNI